MIAVLMFTTTAVAHVGATVVARHRAQSAADLAALAAAGRLVAGHQVACATAAAVATSVHARPAGCTVAELDVTVTVTVDVHLGRWGTGQARAAARAGPV
ncbi:MAG: hypothetical protein K0R68_1637 [Mycobacterium sp.]|nr:hypothetical protein [Mycobacterium sp.]